MPRHGCRRVALAASLTVFVNAALASSPAGRIHRVASANYFVDVDGGTRPQAQQIARRAEQLRREIAEAWLGGALPNSTERSLLYVTLDPHQSSGHTLPSTTGSGHLVWISASLAEATGPLLAHEVAHTVLADRFGTAIPAWANEGIASSYDDRRHRETVQRALERSVSTGRWLDIESVLRSPIRTAEDYAVAVVLTRMLLQRGSRATFIDFLADGATSDIDRALADHYKLRTQAELQQSWQEFARRAIRTGELARPLPLSSPRRLTRSQRESYSAVAVRHSHKTNRL